MESYSADRFEFSGIKSAEMLFVGHTLIVNSNHVGKSMLCKALDLVLRPDRLNRFPPVDEFDFYNADYLAPAAVEESRPEFRRNPTVFNPSCCSDW